LKTAALVVFRKLHESMCELIKTPALPLREHDFSFSLSIRGINTSVNLCEPEVRRLRVAVDFGAMPADHIASFCKDALSANYLLLNSPLAPVFSRHPVSRHRILSYFRPLDASDAEDLLASMVEMASLAEPVPTH
jgi:hypothetical protein